MKSILFRFFGYLLIAWAIPANAFSLRGPGGQVVDLNEEYRWDSSVVTYGFDQSFLDYFGPSGVKDVEDAFRTLNALPRASRIELDKFPFDSRRINHVGAALNLYDLKSATLALVLEQMGLARPTDHVFEFVFPFIGTFPSSGPLAYLVVRNFDPETLLPSYEVNGVLYSNVGFGGEIPIDPLAVPRNAVADQDFMPGQYFTGLTRDDVGGLRYLLSRANINREPSPAGFRRGGDFVRRRGVEKVTFIKNLRFSAGTQLLEKSATRRLIQPDFLFCAGIAGYDRSFQERLSRTDATNWINCAASNENIAGAGPGVIRGPIKITFHKIGPVVTTVFGSLTAVQSRGWGSFGLATNAPLNYPSNIHIREAVVRLQSMFQIELPGPDGTSGSIPIRLPVPYGRKVAFQTSTNQVDWTTLGTVINTGSLIEWRYLENAGTYLRPVPFDSLSNEEQAMATEP